MGIKAVIKEGRGGLIIVKQQLKSKFGQTQKKIFILFVPSMFFLLLFLGHLARGVISFASDERYVTTENNG
jgi:hypothetical protein